MSEKTIRTRSNLLKATIELVAEGSLESFTTKRLAQKAQMAEGNLYNYFKNKDELLEEAFMYIDREIAELFAGYGDNAEEIFRDIPAGIEKMWRVYYKYLVANPQKALYYFHFRNSPRYNEEVRKRQFEYFTDFVTVVKGVDEKYGLFENFPWEVAWIFILDMTTTFASRVARGDIPDDQKTEDQIFMIMNNGILGTLQAFSK
jgi:AcrR family transcriptional regulator